MGMSPKLLRPRQTGFNPKQVANLAAWFDADDASTITLTGSNVSEWRDKSGNGRHATQATAARQPAYTTNSLNGRPALTALGEAVQNKAMSTPAWAYAAGNTALFVFRISAQNQGIYQRNGLNDQPRGAVQSTPLKLRATVGGTNAAQIHSEINYTANNWSVGATVINTNLARAYLNGVYATDATGNTETWNTSTAIRLFSVSDSLYTINGGIAEFIYYDRQLSASEITQVAKYLSKKWNISLS